MTDEKPAATEPVTVHADPRAAAEDASPTLGSVANPRRIRR